MDKGHGSCVYRKKTYVQSSWYICSKKKNIWTRVIVHMFEEKKHMDKGHGTYVLREKTYVESKKT